MSTAVMTENIAGAVPRFKARIAGALYLFGVLTAAFIEMFVRGGLSVAGGLCAVVSMLLATLLFYDIFSQVNRRLCLLAISFNLVGLAIEALRLQHQGANVAIIFDGFYCILIGFLVFRSRLLPRILGALMVLGGLGWLAYLVSPLASSLSPYSLAFGLVGMGSVCLWTLLMESNVTRRKERGDSGERASSGVATRAPLSRAV